MSHSIEELQFAATVRKLALLRRSAQIADDMTDADVAAIKAQPIEPFITSVLKELDWLADFIDQHRRSGG